MTEGRYARQERFAPLGTAGQVRLRDAHVLLVGVGALGSHVASGLVRAGVGSLCLFDRDVVALDNLPRQVLFTEADAAAGRPKAVAAAARLAAITSDCRIDARADEFDAEAFAALTPTPDLVVDGTDNFATRYLINDLAHRAGTPWIYGGALGASGTAMLVWPGVTPCLRCLVPQAPPTGEVGSCETEGILGAAVATVAAFQCAQALRVLSGAATPGDTPGVLSIDVWRGRYALQLRGAQPDPSCPACGAGRYPALEQPARPPATLCGRDAVQVRPAAGVRLDLDRLAARLAGAADAIERTPQLLRFTADGCRFSVFEGGRALLFGVETTEHATTLYDRWVGAR